MAYGVIPVVALVLGNVLDVDTLLEVRHRHLQYWKYHVMFLGVSLTTVRVVSFMRRLYPLRNTIFVMV